MGEGNDFVELLCWPAIERLLDVRPGGRILDIACGNGLTTRRLAKLGFEVEAFDFSTAMIEKAIKRTDEFSDKINYQVLDATSETDLLQLGGAGFEGAISNMALFDMAEIATLFRALSQLLHPDGCHA
jgi:2-polyprenyl-3-methyl-5-hydroxy-6-metoxy-1,4-benzoquinol methylase